MKVLPKLIVFSAPSGAGKTTLVRHLLTQEDLNLAFSISAASREARDGEVHGKDYYFLGTHEFKNRIRANDFLEFEEVYKDQFYGTLIEEVERLWAQGKHVIFDIDVVGGLRLKKKFPNRTLAIFVKPPSINELQIRLKKRKTETAEKIAMRVAKASTEMATAPQFDVIIENDNLDAAKLKAFQTVHEFINKEVSDDEEE
ncbi:MULTISPECIES: guanylate kinase [Nonlabens]|uniref:Guanylate kinase n=1 Tax=Nonlabens xylanidelens TaxID=191564 RepID=A0A2S6IRJ0_9FLAO|nr:guanylate kinase [Nonlabens xylanidelens]PPK96884.1 guanylate kinase [Nonlabens xylanidelens]PQJ13582.1 guanylate kinase [Nonlabens xylanidelens]